MTEPAAQAAQRDEAVAAARERLRAHLAREVALLAAGGDPEASAEAQELVEQLDLMAAPQRPPASRQSGRNTSGC